MFPSRAGLKPSKVSRLVSRLNQDAGEEEGEVAIIRNITIHVNLVFRREQAF